MTSTPISSKKTLSYEDHLKVIDNFIAHESNGMAAMNRYIESVRHPSTTYPMVVAARDKVRKALRDLQGIRLIIDNYAQDDHWTPDE